MDLSRVLRAAIPTFVVVCLTACEPAREPSPAPVQVQAVQTPMCAIDMGSNTFKRIVGSYRGGTFDQRPVERKTLGVGDDVAKNGRISDQKLADIEAALSAFKSSCDTDHASPIVAIGTAVFRDAPNAARVVEMAARLGIAMEVASEQRESELAYLVASLGEAGSAVIDNGSRSIELVASAEGALRHQVFNQGYRVAYSTFFAAADDPSAAVSAFRDRLREETAKAPFMKGKRKLIGLEFGEMADGLFEPAAIEGRVMTLESLKKKLDEITSAGAAAFERLKKQKDIDRALPRLVVAVALLEDFGYTQLELTERELGSGLIIEAGRK